MGRAEDAMEEMLALEPKKLPTLAAKGAAEVIGDEDADPLGLPLAAVSICHSLRVPTEEGGADPLLLPSAFTTGSIFHILNAPQPLADFLVSASSPVVIVGIGGSFTDFVSPIKSRRALAQASDASRDSFASRSSCLVSSNSDLIVFTSLRSASSSSTRESWGGISSD